MNKYNVGDVVKLRDDLENRKFYGGIIYNDEMDIMRNKPVEINEVYNRVCYKVYEGCHRSWVLSDEMIEGLWEECKEKQDKLKLIDVLNMIAKGELKEGTKVRYEDVEYTYKKFDSQDNDSTDLISDSSCSIFEDYFLTSLQDEVELIEPSCEHEWLDWETHRMGEGRIRRYRRCNKCGLEEETNVGKPIEPSKIEELEISDRYYTVQEIIGKLNEVIRKINKE